eukprot:728450-Karenia_brevis.AAC.1
MFVQLLHGIPNIPYDIDPSSHAFIVDSYIKQAASIAFPCGPKAPKKPSLSSSTIDLISLKVQTSRESIKVAKQLRDAAMRACFYCWACNPVRCKWSRVRGFQSKTKCMQQ